MIACVIQVKSDGELICHVHNTYTEKNNGMITINFQNNLDFRTVIQVDMAYLLAAIISEAGQTDNITSFTIQDDVSKMESHCSETLDEGWTICHDAVKIKDNLFKLSALILEFNLKDETHVFY